MRLIKLKDIIKKVIGFLLNPRFILCFGLGWMITNGWSYILLGVGTYYGIEWMTAVAGAYLAFLWLPISPEKIVTVAIAIWLLRLMFPGDKKTLGVLQDLMAKVKSKASEKKNRKSIDKE